MNHRILRSLAVIGLFALTACDIPTSLDDFPTWDVTVRIPNQSDTTTIDDFMPEGVTIDRETSTFVFQSQTYNGSVSSDVLCDICKDQEGEEGLYPRFTYADTFRVNVGGEFDFTRLSGGDIEVDLTHDLPFNLLGSTGFIVASLYTDAGLVSTDTVFAAENEFAPGTTPLKLHLPLQGVRITPDTMDLVIYIDSPGSGTKATLSTAHTLYYDAEIVDPRSASVTVTRGVTEFGSDEPLEITLDEDIREELQDPISRAKVSLTISHPFEGLTGEFVVRFAVDRGGLFVVKSETVEFDQSTTATLELLEDDIRALLQGEAIYVHFDATISGGSFSVRPGDAVVYEVGMEVDVTINEKE